MAGLTKRPYYRWTCWLLAAFAYFIQYGLMVFPSAISHQIRTTLHASSAELGFFSAAFLYTFVFLQIPAGLMFDHFGSRNLMFYSTLLMALGCVVLGVTSNYEVALVGRLLMGIGGSFSFIGAIYLAKAWFPLAMFPVIVGLTEAISGLGEVGFPALFAGLQHIQSWHVIMLEIGMITIIAAFLIKLYVRDRKRISVKHHVDIRYDLVRALKNKRLWMLGLFTGFAYAHFMVMTDMWAVVFLEHRYHIGTLAAIFENSLGILGYTIGCATIAYAVRYFSTRRLMLVCASIILGCHIVLTFFFVNIYIESFILFTIGLATSVVVLCYDLAEKIVPSTAYGVAAGFITMFFGAVGMFVVPLVGYLMQYMKLKIYLASFPVVVCAVFAIIIAIRINISKDFEFCERV